MRQRPDSSVKRLLFNRGTAARGFVEGGADSNARHRIRGNFFKRDNCAVPVVPRPPLSRVGSIASPMFFCPPNKDLPSQRRMTDRGPARPADFKSLASMCRKVRIACRSATARRHDGNAIRATGDSRHPGRNSTGIAFHLEAKSMTRGCPRRFPLRSADRKRRRRPRKLQEMAVWLLGVSTSAHCVACLPSAFLCAIPTCKRQQKARREGIGLAPQPVEQHHSGVRHARAVELHRRVSPRSSQ